MMNEDNIFVILSDFKKIFIYKKIVKVTAKVVEVKKVEEVLQVP